MACLFCFSFILLYISFQSSLKRKTDFRSFILNVPLVVIGTKSFVGPKKIIPDKIYYMGRQGLTGFWYIENNIDVEAEKLDFY